MQRIHIISHSVLEFSPSVVSDSLQPHGLQHARLPCPSPTPRACSNPCPLNRWCYPTISSSSQEKGRPLLFLPSVFPSIRVFSSESVLCIRWPKYWCFSFNISPSNEYSGLISFRNDWFDLLAVQGTLKSLLQQHWSIKSINSLVLRFLYGPMLTSIHDYWKKPQPWVEGFLLAKERFCFFFFLSLLFNMLSRFVNTFLPRIKCLLI